MLHVKFVEQVLPLIATVQGLGDAEMVPEMVLERHLLLFAFHAVPEAQLAVAVFVSSCVLPFLRLNTVCGYATQTWSPGDD